MVINALTALGPWAWWVIGLILLALEIMVPGNVLLWFGIAAIVTGAVAFVADWSWQGEVILFVILAVIFVVVGRRYFGGRKTESADPLLNERARRLIGNVYVLGEPIATGSGRVRIDDTTWRVSGPDLPAGARVKVVGVDGAMLKVEPAGGD